MKLVKQTAFQNETNKANKLLPGNHDWWQKMTKMLEHKNHSYCTDYRKIFCSGIVWVRPA